MLFFALGMRAQAPASSPVVRFTVFSAQPPKDVALLSRANAPVQPVKFLPTARSPRYEYRGAMPLRFVDPDTRAVVAEASIPPGLRDPLLLFLPADPSATGAGKMRYQVAVLDDGPARYGPGALAVINLSGLTLQGTINDQAVALKAGLNPAVAVGRSAKVRLTTTSKQRTYQAYAGQVSLGRHDRALLILFPPYYQGSMEVQSRLLVDQPVAPAARSK